MGNFEKGLCFNRCSTYQYVIGNFFIFSSYAPLLLLTLSFLKKVPFSNSPSLSHVPPITFFIEISYQFFSFFQAKRIQMHVDISSLKSFDEWRFVCIRNVRKRQTMLYLNRNRKWKHPSKLVTHQACSITSYLSSDTRTIIITSV